MSLDRWRHQWDVPSDSNPAKSYVVSEDWEGNYACSCPAWTRHTPRRDCKHIKRVRQGLYPERGAPAPPLAPPTPAAPPRPAVPRPAKTPPSPDPFQELVDQYRL